MQTPSEQATPQQLSYIEQHGHSPPCGLTRAEAAEMIRKIRETSLALPTAKDGQIAQDERYHLGLALDLTRGAEKLQPSNPFYAKRQEFWLDTCREATQMRVGSQEICALYQLHGCRFSLPTTEEAQEVLDALDAALLDWETRHPELFYSTLELNFPELVHRMG
jgi:hypothetical protein